MLSPSGMEMHFFNGIAATHRDRIRKYSDRKSSINDHHQTETKTEMDTETEKDMRQQPHDIYKGIVTYWLYFSVYVTK